MEHQHAEFVDTHYEALLQRVTSVMTIADKLSEKRKLTWEVYSKITKATSKRTQIRELLNAVKSGGPAIKSAFYRELQEIQPDVIRELAGSSENDILRWNPSSEKYRSKIKELQKDSSRKKVGNLYFSRSNKYMIGSGGSGTVYLGLKEDGTEVAIKRIMKDQQESKYFENELKHLRDLNLESKNVVKYVDFAEDEDFYYLALQLCEYDLEDYMENLRQGEQKDAALRKIVEEILLGLQVFHRAGVIHRDIKPGNVLIDSGKNAMLADSGLSCKLEEGRNTVHTTRAGTLGWEATEILNQDSGYKKSSDIQVAGMLVYYILSDGKHPFGDTKDREENIKKGQHSLEDLQDIVAKDLIEWMINKDPAKRLTIDEILRHPYFLDDDSKDGVLRKLGDRPEIQNYETLAKLHKLYKEKGHSEGTDPAAALTINEAFSEKIPWPSAHTSSEVLETESHSQNTEILQMQAIQQRTEDKQITWRNESSTRHATKIKELIREPNIKNIGSLYFYKDEKYMIGSGGSDTQVYIGMKKDGIEVAIKLITKNPKKKKDFENELKFLLDLKLESKNIVRYMTSAVDKDFYYIANQLCEYDLVDYMEYRRQPEQKDKKALRNIVEEMLLGLQVLHQARVIHRDLKPRNVLIDQEERARLADFGISRKLKEGKTTMYTDRAGTQGWEATEILEQFEQGNTELKTHYKRSSDIQVAGMLTYHVLSDGKHPFGDGIRREVNISEGKYSLGDVQDIAAKDLIEWMINKEQDKRPTIDKVLNHPYFWRDKRIREVLHNLGNKEEIQEYQNYKNNKKLYDTVQKYTEGKAFSNWKTKAPKTWTKIGKNLPNDLLGLLRYLRNALGHQEKEFYKEKMIDEFPDFLVSLHRLALEMGWEY